MALDPGLSLSQYVHTSWLQSDGVLIPSVEALAQTADGYLWLGTSQGLWRFDGLRFTRWTAPPGQRLEEVKALAADRSGGLWIGTLHGIEKLEGVRLSDFSGRHGMTGGIVRGLRQDPSGKLWISAAQDDGPGLTVFDGTAAAVLRQVQVQTLALDSGGELWAGTDTGFYLCSVSGGRPQCRPGAPVFPPALVSGPSLPALHRIRAMLRDRDGSIWLGTQGLGLYLVRGGKVERFTRQDGLSSDFVEALVEDREGNIWAGTTNGLDRFREPKVARWSAAEGLAGDGVLAVCATRAGDLWVASLGGALDRIHEGRTRHYHFEPGEIQSIFEDRRKTIWIGTLNGVFRLEGDIFRRVPGVAAAPLEYVFAMTEDGGEAIWIADKKRGLAVIRSGSIEPATIPGIEKDIYQLGAARNGDLWVGYFQGGVALINHGCARRFDARDGLVGGAVQAIFEDRAGRVWVGTTEGLSRFAGGRWTAWTEHDGLPAGGVLGVTEDLAGHFWMLTTAGLAPAPESPGGPGAGKPAPTVYGPGDGIRMRPVAGYVNPRISVAPDGRIWFATADGLASFDPASIRVNRVPPPVGIEELVVDGKKISLTGAAGKVRGRSVEVEYTALSLTRPETVRFRYRLEPVNQGWIDAGTTRRMAYATLSPGRYRFHVTACNDDGEWNSSGTSLDFTIDPRFYQTWWFAILVVGGIGLAGLGMHRARMRLMRGRFQLVLQERTRLARDMHDTLLQGFAGAVYQLAAASQLMNTAPGRGQERMAKALEQADQSLSEARQMLSSLRLSALENRTLAEALRAAGAQITGGSAIRFELTVRGRELELPYEVQASLYIIAREAMSNAASHGEPDRISVLLKYSADTVCLTVKDSGKGFDVDAAECRPDHWGLAGMRERARQVGGTLDIRSSPGHGTTVEATVAKKSMGKAPGSGAGTKRS